MKIIEIMTANWDSILVIAAFLLILAYLAKKGETKILHKIIFGLVTQVEKEFAAGTGRLKLSVVMDAVYQRLPAIVRILFSEKEIELMVEDVLDYAKKLWADNPALLQESNKV